MEITLLKAKIHRAVVTQADLNYVGSVTIDSTLLQESGILEYEKVQIVDIENGNRFETYTIAGEPGSGIICLNGAAAKCVSVGDKVIIMLTPTSPQRKPKRTSQWWCLWTTTTRLHEKPTTRSTDCCATNNPLAKVCYKVKPSYWA